VKIGILKERFPGERRVAATPDSVKKLRDLGFSVHLEAGAGVEASFPDAAYVAAGAEVLPAASEILGKVDLLLGVRPFEDSVIAGLREGMTTLSFLWPQIDKARVEKLAARKVTALAMDAVPRITRAQKMDALSSMANLVGYRAVIEAAGEYGSFFTQQITAAGKVPPAKVLVIGAGVAGLAAIGAARALGAVVRAFDTRGAVREQVQSMGAQFLEVSIQEEGEGGGGYAKEMSPAFIAAEMALFAEQAKEVDIVITTALIPGRPAPKLWKKEHVEAMKPGSVIVDLAAEQGGNCDLTEKDRKVVHQGVKILGYTDYPSRLATTASQLYATNLVHLLTDLGGASKWNVNLQDEVIRGATAVIRGEILPPAPPAQPSPAAAKPAPKVEATAAAPTPSKKSSGGHGHGAPAPQPLSMGATAAIGGLILLVWAGLRFFVGGEVSEALRGFLQHLTVFALACFVGWQVIWSVTPALHTPLMSVTNAISGIILVGGMLHAKGEGPALWLGLAAVLLATINIAGGFWVTQRMLKMFHR
jgi:NAD(P) transhydrogenase subunit alpha